MSVLHKEYQELDMSKLEARVSAYMDRQNKDGNLQEGYPKGFENPSKVPKAVKVIIKSQLMLTKLTIFFKLLRKPRLYFFSFNNGSSSKNLQTLIFF